MDGRIERLTMKADACVRRSHRHVYGILPGERRHWTGGEFRVWKRHMNEAKRLWSKIDGCGHGL